jgi:hypothetical protein
MFKLGDDDNALQFASLVVNRKMSQQEFILGFGFGSDHTETTENHSDFNWSP